MRVRGHVRVYVDGKSTRDIHNRVCLTGYDSCALILGRAACGLNSASGFSVRLYSRGDNEFTSDMVTVNGDFQAVAGANTYTLDSTSHGVSLYFNFSPYSFNGSVELTTAALYYNGELFSVASLVDEDDTVSCRRGMEIDVTWTLTFYN